MCDALFMTCCVCADGEGTVNLLEVADHFSAHPVGVAAVNTIVTPSGEETLCSLGKDGNMLLWSAPI